MVWQKRNKLRILIMLRIFIKQYRPSNGAKALRLALGSNVKLIKCHNSNYRHNQRRHFVINWGASSVGHRVDLNQPEAVAKASNKLDTFRCLFRCLESTYSLCNIEYTTSKDVASSWNTKVFVRHKLSASSGDGIQICQAGDALPDAPLYTKAVEGGSEYRIHASKDGELSFIQQKKKRRGLPKADIKNLENGYVFVVHDIDASEDDISLLKRVGKEAVTALGLDFGAIDCILKDGKVYILEVNTAPGLDGESTLEAYKRYIKSKVTVYANWS
jgi:hypothetical protein